MYYGNHSEVVKGFGEGDDNARSGGNIFSRGNNLYSYGEHFILATRVKDINGREVFLINGDTYSNSTSHHTSICIRNLKPNFQIPFSALNGAGLPYNRVVLVEHQADQYTEENYTDKDGNPQTRMIHHLGGALIKSGNRVLLSGFDENDGFNGYFLCEINTKLLKDLTIASAYEALKPEWLETLPNEVKRQGEWFFVKTYAKTKDLKPYVNKPNVVTDYVRTETDQGAVAIRVDKIRGYRWLHKRKPVTHSATEVRKLGDEFYVRGTIRHTPGQYRRKTHKMLTLGDGWWQPVKNTAIGSWESAGNVD